MERFLNLIIPMVFLHTIILLGVRTQTPTQVVYLNAVSLNEEQLYENYLVYNFNDHLKPSSTFRLEILSQQQQQQSSNQSVNKFRLVDSTYLQLSGSFDREALQERQECGEALPGGGLDSDTDSSTTPPTTDLSSCILNLKIALYNNESSLVKLFVLPVAIHDVNDQRPRFAQTVYHVNVSENLAAPRTTLPLDMPIDLDSDKYSVRECHLLPNNIASTNNSSGAHVVIGYYHQFDVVLAPRAAASAALTLVINGALDRENTSTYSFALVCSDGRFKARAQIVLHVLDANDNLPVVRTPKLNVTVLENESSRLKLVKIDAYDLDDAESPNGQLVFSLPVEINSVEVRRAFEIDRTTGWVSLREALDYEKARRHVLKVRVEDQGANSVPAYAEVLVTVLDTNDNAPSCQLTYSDTYVVATNRTNRTIWINEEIDTSPSSPLTLAYLTLTDADSPSSNGHSLSATLLAVRYLNSSTQELQTESINSSSFRLTPIIAHYGNYYYALQLTRKLDRESTVHFDLTIRLADNSAAAASATSMTTYVDIRVMLVDLNDNYPEFRPNTKIRTSNGVVQFEYFKFSLPENQLALDFGTVEAFDPDRLASSRLEFKILDEPSPHLLEMYAQHITAELNSNTDHRLTDSYLSNDQVNPNYLFFIHPENGTLGVRAELDRERRELYVFTVRVNDTEHTSDVLVEVRLDDVNDNQPVYQLERVEFAFEENREANSVVGNVKPSDPDVRPVTEYFIEPTKMSRYFYVEPLSGNLVAKLTLDAEDKELADGYLTQNNTFEMTVYARDPNFSTNLSTSGSLTGPTIATDIDLRQMSKLQVSIKLVDVNDHRPHVSNPENSLIAFDLAKYANETSSCQNMNLVLKSIESVDNDRDSLASQPHYYKFAYIRRLSWPFVYEILKSHQLPSNSSSNQTTSLHSDLLTFIDSIVRIQTKYDIRPVGKVNLRSVFLMDQQHQSDRRVLNQVNVTLNQLCKLNWGVYNLSILASDEASMTHSSDFSLKMFVYNTIYEDLGDDNGGGKTVNLTEPHLDLLNSMIENWWAANSHLIVGLKRPVSSSTTSSAANSTTKDDNGDYIDGITQEYFKFYASSAFSRFGGSRSSSGSSHVGFWDLTNLVVFKTASQSVVLLIVVFLCVSVALVLFISYKQYKASSTKRGGKSRKNGGNHSPAIKKLSQSSTTAFLNVNGVGGVGQRDKLDSTSSSSTTSSSDISSSLATKQSTKDLSGSPDLAPAKLNAKKITKASKTSSSSSSASSTSSSTNLILYPGQVLQQQQQQLKIKQQQKNASSSASSSSSSTTNTTNPTNEQVSRYVKCNSSDQTDRVTCLTGNNNNNASSSICDSFTVITSLTTAPTVLSSSALTSTTTSQPHQQPYHHHHQTRHSLINTSESTVSNYEQPAGTAATTTTTVYIAASNPTTTTTTSSCTPTTTTVLSTFASPVPHTNLSSASSSPPDTMILLKQQQQRAHLTDQGYYGSSDYSENNSFANAAAARHSHNHSASFQSEASVCLRPKSGNFRVNGLTSNTATTKSAPTPRTTFTQPATTIVNSSFASSSLMSSPSASTDSYSSSDFLHHQSKQPAVTNMYPTSVYANYANLSTKCVETSGCGGEESSSSAASSSSDVKIYLEKFERIYNSTESTGNSVVVVEKPASTALNTFNKQQQQNRNSMTTYSYV